MNRVYAFILGFICLGKSISAQELFPHNDPASNIPKGVLGIRVSNEFYKELNQTRSSQIYRFMFGLSPRWMISQSFSFSNHHAKTLPQGAILDDGNGGYYTHGVKKGGKYPYGFDNFLF